MQYVSRRTNGNFKDIRSIANAYKHLYTGADPNKARHSSISSTGAIEVIPIENEDVNEISHEFLKDSTEVQELVVYTRKTGQQVDFLPVLKSVVMFWEQELGHA